MSYGCLPDSTTPRVSGQVTEDPHVLHVWISRFVDKHIDSLLGTLGPRGGRGPPVPAIADEAPIGTLAPADTASFMGNIGASPVIFASNMVENEDSTIKPGEQW